MHCPCWMQFFQMMRRVAPVSLVANVGQSQNYHRKKSSLSKVIYIICRYALIVRYGASIVGHTAPQPTHNLSYSPTATHYQQLIMYSPLQSSLAITCNLSYIPTAPHNPSYGTVSGLWCILLGSLTTW